MVRQDYPNGLVQYYEPGAERTVRVMLLHEVRFRIGLGITAEGQAAASAEVAEAAHLDAEAEAEAEEEEEAAAVTFQAMAEETHVEARAAQVAV